MSEVVESEDRLDEVMDKIHRRIGTPVLTGLRLEPAGLRFDPETVVPARTPDLFAGVPLCILGRYRGAATGALALQARDAAGGAWAEAIAATSSDNPAIASVWARGHIRELEDRFVSGSGDRTKLEKRIVDTSLRFSVLCRFTAFVAVDRSEVVNQGGQVQRITQPTEAPAGWGMCERLDMTFLRRSLTQHARLLPHPMQLSDIGLMCEQRLSAVPMESVLQRQQQPAPPPSQLDLSAYRRRAQELLEQLQKQAGKDAPTQLGELGSLAVKLEALIEDLKSVGAGESELRPLEALLRDLKALLSARRPKATAIAAALSQAEAVLRAFAQSSAGRQEAFWK